MSGFGDSEAGQLNGSLIAGVEVKGVAGYWSIEWRATVFPIGK